MFDGPFHTRHRSTPRETIAKGGLPSGWPAGDEFFVTSVLTLPHADLVGDVVRPDGLTWDMHRRSPFVDFEHGLNTDAFDVVDVPVESERRKL